MEYSWLSAFWSAQLFVEAVRVNFVLKFDFMLLL